MKGGIKMFNLLKLFKKIRGLYELRVIRRYMDAALILAGNVGHCDNCTGLGLERWEKREQALIRCGYQPSITLSYIFRPPPDIVIGSRSAKEYETPWPQKLKPGEQPIAQAKIYKNNFA
jgi:hypothetical protein